MAHACNPSYTGRFRLKASPRQIVPETLSGEKNKKQSKKEHTLEALSSNPNAAKKKKKKIESSFVFRILVSIFLLCVVEFQDSRKCLLQGDPSFSHTPSNFKQSVCFKLMYIRVLWDFICIKDFTASKQTTTKS
jgi:hypothetical protein